MTWRRASVDPGGAADGTAPPRCRGLDRAARRGQRPGGRGPSTPARAGPSAARLAGGSRSELDGVNESPAGWRRAGSRSRELERYPTRGNRLVIKISRKFRNPERTARLCRDGLRSRGPAGQSLAGRASRRRSQMRPAPAAASIGIMARLTACQPAAASSATQFIKPPEASEVSPTSPKTRRSFMP